MSWVKKIVFSNMEAAQHNAPEIFFWTPEQIAEDMIECASDCERFSANTILPYIKEYLGRD